MSTNVSMLATQDKDNDMRCNFQTTIAKLEANSHCTEHRQYVNKRWRQPLCLESVKTLTLKLASSLLLIVYRCWLKKKSRNV